MPKRFAITLIVISTIVYGSIFALSMVYSTSFFDEMVIQLNRMATNMSNMDEIQHSRLILNTIFENEQPPETWQALILSPPDHDLEQFFYFYKVWIIKKGLTPKDVKGSYCIFKSGQDQLTIMNMRYGKNKPVLQFPFYKTQQGQLKSGLFFAINELPFSADLNKDNTVDQKDVLMAMKK